MQQFVFEMNDALYHNLMQKYGKDDIQEFGIRFFEMLTYSPKHAKQKQIPIELQRTDLIVWEHCQISKFLMILMTLKSRILTYEIFARYPYFIVGIKK